MIWSDFETDCTTSTKDNRVFLFCFAVFCKWAHWQLCPILTLRAFKIFKAALKTFHTFGLFIGGDITSIEFQCCCYCYLIAKTGKPTQVTHVTNVTCVTLVYLKIKRTGNMEMSEISKNLTLDIYTVMK